MALHSHYIIWQHNSELLALLWYCVLLLWIMINILWLVPHFHHLDPLLTSPSVPSEAESLSWFLIFPQVSLGSTACSTFSCPPFQWMEICPWVEVPLFKSLMPRTRPIQGQFPSCLALPPYFTLASHRWPLKATFCHLPQLIHDNGLFLYLHFLLVPESLWLHS